MYDELRQAAEAAVENDDPWHPRPCIMELGFTEDDADFIAECDPQTILEMIATLERVGAVLDSVDPGEDSASHIYERIEHAIQ